MEFIPVDCGQHSAPLPKQQSCGLSIRSGLKTGQCDAFGRQPTAEMRLRIFPSISNQSAFASQQRIMYQLVSPQDALGFEEVVR